MISWSVYWRSNSEWTIRHQQEYVHGADFYTIEHLRYRDHNEALIKCQLYEIDIYHYHPPVDHHKKPIYRFNRDDSRKFKLLLESTVRVIVVPASNSDDLSPFECEPSATSLFNWLSYLVFCLLVSLAMHFFIQFAKKQIRKRNRSCRTSSVRFNEYKFDTMVRNEQAATSRRNSGNFTLNAVSSVELIRKSKRFKSPVS